MGMYTPIPFKLVGATGTGLLEKLSWPAVNHPAPFE